MQKNWSLVKVCISLSAHYHHIPAMHEGILGAVLIDNVRHQQWKAHSLEFKYSFMARYVADIFYQVLSW